MKNNNEETKTLNKQGHFNLLKVVLKAIPPSPQLEYIQHVYNYRVNILNIFEECTQTEII